MRLLTSIAIASAVLVALGCRHEPPGPARDGSPIVTDSVVYHLARRDGAYVAFATARYVNRTGTPVLFARCGGPGWLGLRRWRRRAGADSTRALFVDEMPACAAGEPPAVLASGASVTVRMRLGAFPQQNMDPPLQLEQLTGRMRIEFAICQAPPVGFDDCVLVPQAERRSNAFDVRF